MYILAGNIRSSFRYSETYLRTEDDLVEDDIRIVLSESISNFNVNEILQSIVLKKISLRPIPKDSD